jgi:hypothetical protein
VTALREHIWLRLLLEAVAIILAAVVAGVLHAGAAEIVTAVIVVWVISAIVEHALARPKEERRPRQPRRARAEEAKPAAKPSTIVAVPQSFESVRVLPRDEPETEPEPEPEPEPQPAAAVVEPEPEPEPELEAEPEPEPEPEVWEPRSWNLWELERAARERGDTNEERDFLFLYLRDYADPTGTLPVDFDGLIRDSFADLLTSAAG